MNISTASTEYVRVNVSALIGGTIHDPTGDPVSMAFIPSSADPTDPDWHPGTWETAGNVYKALCLVGPANGGVVLPDGQYAVWVKVTDSPEVPVLRAGILTMT